MLRRRHLPVTCRRHATAMHAVIVAAAVFLGAPLLLKLLLVLAASPAK